VEIKVLTWEHLCKAPFYSVMADECTDSAAIEEPSHWVEDGEPAEYFFDMVPLKKPMLNLSIPLRLID